MGMVPFCWPKWRNIKKHLDLAIFGTCGHGSDANSRVPGNSAVVGTSEVQRIRTRNTGARLRSGPRDKKVLKIIYKICIFLRTRLLLHIVLSPTCLWRRYTTPWSCSSPPSLPATAANFFIRLRTQFLTPNYALDVNVPNVTKEASSRIRPHTRCPASCSFHSRHCRAKYRLIFSMAGCHREHTEVMTL